MAKIIRFPTQPDRSRYDVESFLRKKLASDGTSEDDIAFILGNMADFFALLDFGVELTIDPRQCPIVGEAIEAFTQATKERTNLLILERLNAEIARLNDN